MSVANLITENKFQDLAIVICHLFLGGNFNQFFLIHEPKIMDYRLIQEINLQCPNLRWIISDFYNPKPYADRNGYDTLQLFVIKQDQYFDEIDLVESFVAYHSIFIFDSNFSEPFEQTRTLVTGRSSLAMVHDTTSHTVQLFLLTGGYDTRRTIHLNGSQLNRLTPAAAFEMTFGERERIRETSIFLIESFCSDWRNREVNGNYYQNFFLANFFFRQMNMSFFKTLRHQCDPSGDELFFTYRRITRPVYDEISIDSALVKVNNRPFLEELENVTIFCLDPISRTTFLYQFHSLRVPEPSTEPISSPFRTNIFFEFIYGDDFNRSNAPRIWMMILENAWLFCLYIATSVVVLCLIRRKAKLPSDGVISVFFDVLIAVIGGGNLKYHHKWERAFFVILFFGSFLLNTICVDNFLYYTFSFAKENRMDSAEKMVAFNTPVRVTDFNLVERRIAVEDMIWKKLGRKVNFTTGFIDEDKSRAFVITESTARFGHTAYEKENLFFDEIDIPVFVTVHDLLPNKLATTFEKLMQCLMESGLYKFYSSYASYLKKIRSKSEERTHAYGPISLNQIYFHLLMYSSCLLIATCAFFVELMVNYSQRIRRVRRNN